MNEHRAELAETFEQMTDEELLERWNSGHLTDVAVEVARREFARRGIDAPKFVITHPNLDDMGDSKDVSFVTVARSLDPMQMEILRARLEAEGIEAFVADAGINQMNPLYSIAVGGVRLVVTGESAGEARRIISLIQSGQFSLRDDDPLPP